MDDVHDKLRQLQQGDVLLPEEQSPVGGPQGGEGVVAVLRVFSRLKMRFLFKFSPVHDGVNEGVDERKETGRSGAGHQLDGHPNEEGRDAVVVGVQCANLAVLLAQHKEDRVGHVGELGEHVNVEHATAVQRLRRPVRRTGKGKVEELSAVVQTVDRLAEKPHTDENVVEVVEDEGGAQLKGLTAGHQPPRSGDFDEKDVHGDDGHHRQWTACHQEIVPSARVALVFPITKEAVPDEVGHS